MHNTVKFGFRIGRWDVYPQQNLLKSPEHTKTLEPKVMDVLVFLAERQGEVVSRQQLLDAVWREVVVGDEVVSRAVSLLRTELGDDQKNPRYVKTFSKRGYCLIADVILASSNEPQPVESVSDASASTTAENPTELITRRTMRKLSFTIVTVLALALAYFAVDIFLLQPESDHDAGYIGNSIAVLPFVNMSADSDNEYFSDGLSEELLNLLTKIPELRVAARTSSFSFKGKDVKISQIGKELSVTHVLEGSVRKTGNRIRITAQLVKTDDGFRVWSETYSRTPSDIFATQDEIAASVVKALKVSILGAIPTQKKTDPEVYALYLQGKYFVSRRDDESLQKALTLLKQALAIDPDYAQAWLALNITYTYLTFNGTFTRAEGSRLAHTAVDRALAIDSNMASAWAARAYWLKTFDGDWVGAQAAIERAIALDPNNRSVVAVAASLANTLGQFPRAIALLEQSVALDPLGLGSLNSLARSFIRVGRFDDAIKLADRMMLLNPKYPNGATTLSRAYLLKGDPKRALTELEKNPSLFNAAFKARLHFTLGNEVQSQAFIKEVLASSAHQNPGMMASVYAWRGENDAAFEWLNLNLQQRTAFSQALGNEWVRGLVDDSRYPIFLEKVGLLEAWKAMPAEHGGPSKP